MLKQQTTKKRENGLLLILALIMFLSIIGLTTAQQTGAQLTNISTTQKNSSDPQYGNHSKGAIHTVNLNADQQDTKWKAYVGNVTSTFVLDDSGDYSIYQWTMDSFSGQVYITRDSSVTWSTVDCAAAANKATEDTAIHHTSTAADSVNRTFSSQTHRAFSVGTNSISAGECYSTATWQNDTQPTLTNSTATAFQEVLLWDSTGGDMIYTTFVENDKASYRGVPTTYDFQAIVPDDGTASNPALTYYFYLELS